MNGVNMIISFLLLPAFAASFIPINLQPRQIVTQLEGVHRFNGTNGRGNHFKLLEQDGDSLLVGAKNYVYNLSMTTMASTHRIVWEPPNNMVETCSMKGKTQEDCQNYIRVLARQTEGQVLICGTYAFSPMCRIYMYDPSSGTGNYKMSLQFDGTAISPYDPHDNSTAIYLAKTDEIISGTMADFVGNDPVIYRKRLMNGRKGESFTRTSRDDVRVLDSPNFVGSFEYDQHIYLWFREKAVEAVDNNEERQVYARVGRVCKNDKGWKAPASDKWTTFLKARLNCSIGAATPFYFNELKAVSDPVVNPKDNRDSLVYAVFSTPDTTVRMSAVCVFSMKAIKNNFDTGTFKTQKSLDSQWTEVLPRQLPSERPGRCVPDSTQLDEKTVSFITRNPLMHAPVSSIRPPLFMEGAERAELTQIAVLSQVPTMEGTKYDIIYVGTSDGKVMKAVNLENETVLVQSAIVFQNGAPIVNLLPTPSRLVVISPDEVASIPTEQCNVAKTCSQCVRLRDPHCAWEERSSSCVSRLDESIGWRNGDVIQNVVKGESTQCPPSLHEDENGVLINNDVYTARSTSISDNLPSSSPPYTGQSIALACLVCIIVASVVGFVVGYRIATSKKMAEGAHHSASSTSGSDYDSFGRARLTRHDSLTAASGKLDQVYIPPSKHSVDATSLVIPPTMSMSHHGGSSGATTPGRDRNALMTSLNNTTLPRDYKVKKVYL